MPHTVIDMIRFEIPLQDDTRAVQAYADMVSALYTDGRPFVIDRVELSTALRVVAYVFRVIGRPLP